MTGGLWLCGTLALTILPAKAQGPLEEYAVDLPPRTTAGVRIGLDEALERALAENLEIALSRNREELARRRRATVGAGFFPGLELGLAAGRQDGRVQGSFGELRDVAFSTYTDGGAVVYRANIAARLRQRLAEREGVEAARLDTLGAEQQLQLRVVELYHDLLLSTVGVGIAEDVVAGSEQFLKVVEARTEAGLGLGADVARAEAKLAGDREQLVQMRNLLDDARTRLAVTLRLDAGTPLAPADDRLVPAVYPEPPAPEARERPDVQAALRRIASAEKRSSAARWAVYAPELQAKLAALEIGDATGDREGRHEWRALLQWSVFPVAFAERRELRVEEAAARLQATALEEQARAEIRRARQDLEAAGQRIPHAGRALEAARVTLRLSEERFRAGAALALEVLDAQETLSRARFDLARAIVEYNVSQARLLAASGAVEPGSFANPISPRPADGTSHGRPGSPD